MLSLFEQLNREAAQRGVRFLVIGGHAVIEHGFQRGTEDADILVSKEERNRWLEILSALNYTLLRDAGTFLQFEPANQTNWDLDLMLVPAEFSPDYLRTEKGPDWKEPRLSCRVWST